MKGHLSRFINSLSLIDIRSFNVFVNSLTVLFNVFVDCAIGGTVVDPSVDSKVLRVFQNSNKSSQ